MKKILLALASAFLLSVIACDGDDDTGSGASAQTTCQHFESLCNSTTTTDAGTTTITYTCKPDQVDSASNAAEVKACINSATDCNAATQCALKAKK